MLINQLYYKVVGMEFENMAQNINNIYIQYVQQDA